MYVAKHCMYVIHSIINICLQGWGWDGSSGYRFVY